MSAKLIPGQLAPMLECDTLAHGRFDLSAEAPAGGTLVVFHHGVACKWDRRKLKELDDRIGDFAIRGLRLIAISADSREETARLQEEMQLIRLPLAFGLPVAELAAEWGIYTGCDPASASGQLRFEPAQIWVTQSGQIGLCTVQSTGNLWPDVNFLLRALDQTSKALEMEAAG